MSNNDLSQKELTSLTSNANIDFAIAVNELIKKLSNDGNDKELLSQALFSISSSDLSLSEKCRRSSILIGKVPHSIKSDREFIERLSNLPKEIKSGIASAFPVDSLPLLYKRQTSNSQIQTLEELENKSKTSSFTRQLPLNENSEGTVLLLSIAENQDANINLLRSEGFPVYRVTNNEDLITYLSSPDICGFVIDSSYWSNKTAEEQNEILIKVAQYSTISCLFIDRTAFHDQILLNDMISEIRFRTPNHLQLRIRDSSSLTIGDMPCFKASAVAISPNSRPQFLLADLSEIETTALIATAMSFYKEECSNTSEALRSVQISSINGGLSGAKIVSIYFNGRDLPIVAKLGNRDSILNEVSRFKTYISRLDNHLKPYVHFHCDIGVIIWGAVEDATRPLQLAPTLQSKIEEASNNELWGNIVPKDRIAERLLKIIKRICKKLVILNKNKCDSSKHESFAYLRGSSLKNLLKQGINWNLPYSSSKSLQECIESAYQVLEQAKDKATVHADVHLKNILVRDSSDPYLIDYAYCGPGHPAYDLVRLECSLTFQFLRQLGTEDEVVELQKAISINFDTLDVIKKEHSIWFSSQINAVLIEGATICRDECLKVLKSYGLDKIDYLAAKFIICCWSVGIASLQTGIVRGSIRALASEF